MSVTTVTEREATTVASLPDPFIPTPDDCRRIVGAVVPCEVNAMHPCARKHPEPAYVMVVWSECNCKKKHQDPPWAYCRYCYDELLARMDDMDGEYSQCGKCHFLFRPPLAIVKETILL